MQTDSQLRADVLAELGWDARVRESDFTVEVRGGIVVLTGTVGSWAERVVAQQAAHRVAGVLDVVNDIEVRLPTSSAQADTDLAHAVRHALHRDDLLPEARIASTVDHGTVTLEGEVDLACQREEAERAVRDLTGVRRLVNKIRIEPMDVALSEQVRKAIVSALSRRLERELAHLNVEVQGGRVALSGSVTSLAERRAAVGAAESAPGVHGVDDHLHVEP